MRDTLYRSIRSVRFFRTFRRRVIVTRTVRARLRPIHNVEITNIRHLRTIGPAAEVDLAFLVTKGFYGSRYILFCRTIPSSDVPNYKRDRMLAFVAIPRQVAAERTFFKRAFLAMVERVVRSTGRTKNVINTQRRSSSSRYRFYDDFVDPSVVYDVPRNRINYRKPVRIVFNTRRILRYSTFRRDLGVLANYVRSRWLLLSV